ncbi:polymer-forming cytoskeletal protein [Paenibacillus sp.]|uniref:bactofilin family protein n=1 Tax=Paenibacillus sp. TaxID=58172 RepID=UPI002D3AA5BA|nr:polymer-forming cytoskeletal protein [Paenibacillus sp.]HZG55157.1 polymer-forming cytoskeletal protein [Paenibacillus sp.]
MFRKRSSASSAKVSATDTFIGEGTILEGKLVTTASLRIEGTVVGDIECAGDVTIGETGNVRSIIAARSVFNAGTIEGSVAAKGKMTITSKGRVLGNISAASLHVSEGAVFKGECAMEVPRGAELRPTKEKHGKEKAQDAKQASA